MSKAKLGIFVDVQNIYYTTRDNFGRSFNYRALWQQLDADFDIAIANAYAIDRNDSQQQKFQFALGKIGFDVKLKPYIQRADGSAKGDWDVGITIDVMDASPQLDEVLLVSGDGDFDRLLVHVKSRYQVKTSVLAVQPLAADSLQRACDNFISINENLLI